MALVRYLVASNAESKARRCLPFLRSIEVSGVAMAMVMSLPLCSGVVMEDSHSAELICAFALVKTKMSYFADLMPRVSDSFLRLTLRASLGVNVVWRFLWVKENCFIISFVSSSSPSFIIMTSNGAG